jgi:hypothetical protein
VAVSQPNFRKSYNERLFSPNTFRAWLHTGRFRWFRTALKSTGLTEFRVVEIGCFDGRLLEYFPVPPARYEGLDAGWEGGLTIAQEKFKGHKDWRFRKALDSSALQELPDKCFNVGAALETLEHVPPHLVDGYLCELARVVDGFLFVTVPVEKGMVFLPKWLYKRWVLRDAQGYTLRELAWAVLSQPHKIRRHEHKGFDYAVLAKQIQKHFDIVRLEGMPVKGLPLGASFHVCMLAKSRNR